MTVLNRYPEFFEVCKRAFPRGGLNFANMSNSDIDSFVIAYMTDLGGEAARAAEMLKASGDEAQLEDAHSACHLEIGRLADHYNDWCEINAFVEQWNAIDSKPVDHMHEAGHKWSDF